MCTRFISRFIVSSSKPYQDISYCMYNSPQTKPLNPSHLHNKKCVKLDIIFIKVNVNCIAKSYVKVHDILSINP